ncbi:MAG: hypothetical protein CMO01_27130 [Thalassobius sp.]|nr:hypothetical protein [Thalassovita sp.]
MKFAFGFSLILVSISISIVNAQDFQHQLDSLSHLITTLPAKDTTTINLRNDFLKQALFANPSDSTLLKFANETLAIAEGAAYYKGILLAYERLALVFQYSFSNPYKALDYYHKGLTIAEKYPDLKSLQWGIYGGIGTIYYEQEEYDKALYYFLEVLHNNKSLALTATANIANVYGSINKVDSAIFYYQKALSNGLVESNLTYKANLYSNLSLMYEKAGEGDSAVMSAEKSLALIEANGIEFVRPTAYANASMAYLKNNDLKKAEYYALESLKLSEKQGNLFLQKSAWGTLADLYSGKKEYQKALEAQNKFSILKDSINNQNRRVEINQQQMEFDFDKERTLAKAEIERQITLKNNVLLGGGILLLATVVGFILYKKRQDVLREKKEAEFKALVSETELKALRSQINPHFIFNSLNSIADYYLKNDQNTAQEYLAKFARLMRMVLENSEHQEISLSDDLKFIELYLQVEAKRLPGKFIYKIVVDTNLDAENILVPPLLLQPFIENSIWHGFVEKDKLGYIEIEIKKEDNLLICIVDDNGIGRGQTNANNAKKSLGIAITENRLKILNNQKKTTGKLKIIDKLPDKGTRVEVSVPLETYF